MEGQLWACSMSINQDEMRQKAETAERAVLDSLGFQYPRRRITIFTFHLPWQSYIDELSYAGCNIAITAVSKPHQSFVEDLAKRAGFDVSGISWDPHFHEHMPHLLCWLHLILEGGSCFSFDAIWDKLSVVMLRHSFSSTPSVNSLISKWVKQALAGLMRMSMRP